MGKRWANLAAEILSGVAGGLIALLGAADLAGARLLVPASTSDLQRALDVTVMATGLAAAAIASRPVRQRIARWVPIDPDSPVHALALALSMILFGTDVAVIAFTDVLATAQSQPALSLADLLYQEAPFLVFAFIGVGLFLRRELPDTSRRLGLVVPAWWQPVLALAAAGVFFAFAQGMDGLAHQWTPGTAHRIDDVTTHVFGQLGGPLGIAALAVAPGLCEELLFRGALQPRIGIVATALLFTSIHTQYALSIDTAAVFAIALGLGVLRKYTNTTASCACHITYNLLVGVGLTSSLLGPALATEAVLIGVSVYAVWNHRRRASAAVEP